MKGFERLRPVAAPGDKAVVVCAAAVALNYVVVYRQERAVDQSREQIADQGPRIVEQMLTYGKDTMKDDFARARSLATDSYRPQLVALQEAFLAGEWADRQPAEVEARGEAYMRPPVEDVVFCYMRFPSGRAAHMHLSWLDPHKARRFTVVGAKRMATFDDMDLERKITVYDKGFDEAPSSYGEYITRSGDIWSPRIPSLCQAPPCARRASRK